MNLDSPEVAFGSVPGSRPLLSRDENSRNGGRRTQNCQFVLRAWLPCLCLFPCFRPYKFFPLLILAGGTRRSPFTKQTGHDKNAGGATISQFSNTRRRRHVRQRRQVLPLARACAPSIPSTSLANCLDGSFCNRTHSLTPAML